MTRIARYVRPVAKILAICFVLFLVAGFVILKWMERSPAQLKVGLESYLTQIAGYPADIGSLKKISFVPFMSVEMGDVRLWALDDPDRTMIGARSVAVRMPFWSVMTGMPRFSALSVEDVVVDEDVSGIAPLTIERLYIDGEKVALEGEGKIGDLSVTLSAPLEKTGSGFKPKRPPLRLFVSLSGARTQGDVFIDVNKDGYGATADFPRYAAVELRGAQLLLERFLDDRGMNGTLPVRVNIGRLENAAGPFDIPVLAFENGALQPVECFYNNRARAGAKPHPCAAYFQEPDTDELP